MITCVEPGELPIAAALSLAGAVVDVAGAAGSVARGTFVAAFRADVAAALSAQILIARGGRLLDEYTQQGRRLLQQLDCGSSSLACAVTIDQVVVDSIESSGTMPEETVISFSVTPDVEAPLGSTLTPTHIEDAFR